MLKSMEVVLTVENTEGELSRISATDADYYTALAAAQAKIPEGSRAINIRVPDRDM